MPRAAIWSYTAIFKQSHVSLQRRSPVTSLSSAPFSPPCKAQGELISHLAPRPLCTQPHQALSRLEQAERVLIGPQRRLKTCVLGLVRGAAARARNEHLHPSLHLSPSPPQHQPFLNRAAPRDHLQPLAVALQTCSCSKGGTGSAGTRMTTRARSSLCGTAKHPKETSQAVKISQLKSAKR